MGQIKEDLSPSSLLTLFFLKKSWAYSTSLLLSTISNQNVEIENKTKNFH